MASLQPKQGCLGLAKQKCPGLAKPWVAVFAALCVLHDAPAQERAITASGARIE